MDNSLPSENDRIFELAGPEPVWIWARTCDLVSCECRSVLVLATHAGREFLLERGAAALDALNRRRNGLAIPAAIDGLIVFHVDIDTAEVDPPIGDELLAVPAHPRISDVAMRIDGDLLDAFNQLWYRGKGLPDLDQEVLAATEIVVKGWRRGGMLAWDEVFTGARQDVYVLEGRHYEAVDMYCPVPECECGEVAIDFAVLALRGAPRPGRIAVQLLSGVTEITPGSKRERDRLGRLWVEFRRRHPNYLARFARRHAVMKRVGARVVEPAAVVSSKIGRNEACPCGSGKKYKNCCGAG